MVSAGSASQKPVLHRRTLPVLIVVSISLFLVSGPPVLAAVEVISSLELDEAVDWYFETDIGMLHVYAASQLHTVDLLEKGRTIHDPIDLPGAKAPGSVIHLPAMPYLFAATADSGLKAGEWKSGSRSSYLVDVFTGGLLWEEAPRADLVDVFTFPFEDRFVIRTGKHGETLTGLALSSGREEWALDFAVKAVWAAGSVLEVRGEKSASIDAITGEVLRWITIPVPEKAAVSRVPGTDDVVVWRGEAFAAYSVPNLDRSERPVGGSSPTIGAKRLWEFESQKKTPTKACRQVNVPCGPQLVPDGRLLLNGSTRIDLLDFRTGEMVWSRKEQRRLRATAVSPSGMHGAIPGSKVLTVVDMTTGEDIAEIRYPKGAKPGYSSQKAGGIMKILLLMSRVVWPTDNEVVVILQDNKGRPRGVMRFDAAQRKLVWSRDLPPRADYPRTSGERAKLIGSVALSVALTLVSIANPIAVGGSSYYFVFTPNWRARSSPDLGFDPFSRGGLEQEVPEWLRDSQRRYLRRSELLQHAQDRDAIFVTGKDGDYALQSVDLKTGDLKTLGTYQGSPIHSIEPDSVYRLAVSLERQKKVLRLLSLSE